MIPLTPKRISVVDYGIGNLRSVANAIQTLGYTVELVTEPAEVDHAEHLVLPGVGNFGAVVTQLNTRGFFNPIQEFLSQNRPFLGICVGMQILFEGSSEAPGSRGFGFFKGSLSHLRTLGIEAVTPSIGHNALNWRPDSWCTLQKGYFVHNYFVSEFMEPEMLATYSWGSVQIPAAFGRGNVAGVQFHPEKSGPEGLRFLDCLVKRTQGH